MSQNFMNVWVVLQAVEQPVYFLTETMRSHICGMTVSVDVTHNMLIEHLPLRLLWSQKEGGWQQSRNLSMQIVLLLDAVDRTRYMPLRYAMRYDPVSTASTQGQNMDARNAQSSLTQVESRQ